MSKVAAQPLQRRIIKATLIGEKDTGKSEFLLKLGGERKAEKLQPMEDVFQFENSVVVIRAPKIIKILHGETKYKLALHNTMNFLSADDVLRQEWVAQTDIFLLFFSLTEKKSISSIPKYIELLHLLKPNAPIILVGTKKDLIQNAESLLHLLTEKLQKYTGKENSTYISMGLSDSPKPVIDAILQSYTSLPHRKSFRSSTKSNVKKVISHM